MQNNKTIKNILKFVLKIFPIIFWILLIFGFDIPHVAVLTLVSALIHELAHILASALLCGGFRLNGAFFGFRLGTKKSMSYKAEILIAAAGPGVNLLMFMLLLPFYSVSDYILTFGVLNLLTAISNLLPVESYDGYRIIECTAGLLGAPQVFVRILQAVSFCLISIFCLVALYFMKNLDGGYWIFFIFLAILIKTVKNDKRVFFTRKNEKK